jgi:electron transfer flavoprotein alpha subunit
MYDPLDPRDVEPRTERIEVDMPSQPKARLIERKPAPAWDLDEADTVVCVGSEVDKLPELPEGVALGGTREVCDRGLLSRNRQIGLFGRPVAPRVLVAIGMHGDFEQLTGFVKAHAIVAINAARDAPMLQAADVGLVGDWRELLPSLLATL